MAKKIIKKKKISECCKAPIINGVQCENCGSNGKFTTGTAIVKKLDKVITLLEVKTPPVKNPSLSSTGERFIDNGDGTISDTKLRLMWQKEGSTERLNYAGAENFVEELNKEEYPDWRLPTVEELFSLVDFTKKDPAINPIFKCESSWYWTSTPVVGFSNFAWFVYFDDGLVGFNYRSGGYYVRPCRQY